MKGHVIQTADGSSTIRLEEIDENYHSGHGAVRESRHVFIENGLSYLQNHQCIRVFEVGFGTGLNAVLAAEFALKNKCSVHYSGIEAYPVEEELIAMMNYNEYLSSDTQEIYRQMHLLNWNELHHLSSQFKFRKLVGKIQEWRSEPHSFDIVFFDAFGPRAQEEMWDIMILSKMYQILVSGGIFVTYSARGKLKRDLRSLGFEVETLPGPPGKREMTRGVKI